MGNVFLYGNTIPALSLIFAGCADLTNPSSVLWCYHPYFGICFSKMSAEINSCAKGLIFTNTSLIPFFATSSSHSILTYCLSEEMWIHLSCVGCHPCICIVFYTIGLSSWDSLSWDWRVWQNLEPYHCCSLDGSITGAGAPCGPLYIIWLTIGWHVVYQFLPALLVAFLFLYSIIHQSKV